MQQLARSLVQVLVLACAAHAESPASFRLSGRSPTKPDGLSNSLVRESRRRRRCFH